MVRNTRKISLFLPILLICLLFQSCQSNSTATKNDALKIDLEKLLGKWELIDNPKIVVELTANRMYSYNDGLKLSDEALTIYHNCVSHCIPKGVEQMPCMISDGKQAENCFRIYELTAQNLTYALKGQEDKKRRFRKIP